jgi:predicted DNA-binding mobile mystery protein A
MRNETRRRARLRLDKRLLALKPEDRFRPPPKGWLRAIRDALGMSGVQFAQRLRVSPQSVDALEKSEAIGTIRLNTLRRAAEALDCQLVYALVPNRSLEGAVRERARNIALRELSRVEHSMALEDQGVGDTDLEERVQDYVRELLNERELWREP